MRTSLSGLILLTLRDLWATKTILALFIISTLVWIFLSFALNIQVVDGSLTGLQIFGQDAISPEALQEEAYPGEEVTTGDLILEDFVLSVEAAVASLAYWIGTLLALFAAAPLFTSMLKTGHIELLMSKPYGRTTLLLGHVGGVLIMMLALAVYLMGMTWLVMSIQSGVWNESFLLTIPILVIMFAVLYAIIILLGVYTENTGLALLAAYGVIFLSIILSFHDEILAGVGTPAELIFLAFYHALPNFAEVTTIISQIGRQEAIDSWYPFISSVIVGIVLFGIAAYHFSRRDF